MNDLEIIQQHINQSKGCHLVIYAGQEWLKNNLKQLVEYLLKENFNEVETRIKNENILIYGNQFLRFTKTYYTVDVVYSLTYDSFHFYPEISKETGLPIRSEIATIINLFDL